MNHRTHTLLAGITFAFCALIASISTTYAATYTGVDVRIEAGDTTVDTRTVYVSSDGCTVEDTTGAKHTITGATAICALHLAAQEGGYTYALQNSSYGLYLTQVGSYASTSSQFWMYYVDGTSPSQGIDAYALTDGQELVFTYGSGMNPPLTIDVNKSQRAVGRPIRVAVGYYAQDYTTGANRFVSSVGTRVQFGDQEVVTDAFGRAVIIPKKPGSYTVYAYSDAFTKSKSFTVVVYDRQFKMRRIKKDRQQEKTEAMVGYLTAQIEKGELDAGSLEWSMMALAAVGKQHEQGREEVLELDPSVAQGAMTQDIARHIMTLEAMGEDSRNTGDINYVARLKKTFVEGQFGDTNNCVDDIFAAYALIAADESYGSEYMKGAVNQTLRCINEDGSVSFMVDGVADMDTTAVWLGLASRAVNHADELGLDIKEQRRAATQFVRAQQNPDGGWGYVPQSASNSSTTAWMVMGLQASGHSPQYMTTNFSNGLSYLWGAVQNSGAVAYNAFGSESVEQLNTAYSVMALSGKSFPVNKGIQQK